eukprot:jgi/Undpi1/3878/HiC_scaffold_16.g07246.m1
MKAVGDDPHVDVENASWVSVGVKPSAVPRPPKAVSSPAPTPAGQEREALLARASLNQPKRHRSDSYGSRGPEDAARTRQSSSNASQASPEPSGARKSLVNKGSTPLLEKGEGGKVEKGIGSGEGRSAAKDGSTLVMAFIVMIFVGTGNRVFMKLQTYPMYNYPFFLTMLSTFIYVPVCFAYIIPMLAFGSAITPAQRAIPKFKFAVMGLLDSVAGIMGVFAVNYINNAAMIVLLQQAAIPISMSISKLFLGAKYTIHQYIGATVVIAGIIVTLIPTFLGHPSGGDDADAAMQIVWSGVQVLSCIPMCLSSVYKEKALGDDDMDVIYLNGWVAVYQFMASLLFAVPSAYAMGLPVSVRMGGVAVVLQRSTKYRPPDKKPIHYVPPDHCGTAPFFVTMYLCFNLVYNVVLIVILKYGSANVLFLASTVMVPIGNVAFSLKFVPHHQDLKISDTMGLLFILTGTRARLLRSPEQIRSSFMHRLGLPPSPLVAATPISRGSSPYFGLQRGVADPRAPPGSYRASPGASRESPSSYSTSPGRYRAIPDTRRAGNNTGSGYRGRKSFSGDGSDGI